MVGAGLGSAIFLQDNQTQTLAPIPALDLIAAQHTYERPGRYTVAVKVIDIFGNETMTLVPVNVGSWWHPSNGLRPRTQPFYKIL